jgi:multidrug efflux pump subunit AcrA (membrane-fusion protein)
MKTRTLPFRMHLFCVVAVSLSIAAPTDAAEPQTNQSAAPTRVPAGAAEPVVEVIRTKRAGTVVALLVKPGDVVSKDQVLGHIELDAAKLSVDTARANLEATGTLDQMFWQYQALTVTRGEMEEAVRKRTAPKSRLQYALHMEKWAKAQLEAQQDLKKVQKINFEHYQNEYESRFFRAPIEGVVTEVKVAVGQVVGIGAVAFTVSNESRLSVPVAVPVPAAAAALQAGKLSLRAEPGQPTIWAKVAGGSGHPSTPGVKKSLHLSVNKSDLPAGVACKALKVEVLVPDGCATGRRGGAA